MRYREHQSLWESADQARTKRSGIALTYRVAAGARLADFAVETRSR